jgi:hypothetical protein
MRDHLRRLLTTSALVAGVGVLSMPLAAQDARDGDHTLAQHRASLAQDLLRQTETLNGARDRLHGVMEQLGPLVRVCTAGGTSLTRVDAERAERSAEAIHKQLRDASEAAKACTAPDALKAAHNTLSDAIDETRAIEQMAATPAGDARGSVPAPDGIREGLAALDRFTNRWSDIEAGFDDFNARVSAYQKQPGAETIKAEAAFRAESEVLTTAVKKVADVRGQLMDCQHTDRGSASALTERVNAARRRAAGAFATYGESITRDSARCQTRLEMTAKPGDRPELAAAVGREPPPSTEPPPPKAAPVTPVVSDSLSGSMKQKSKPEKRTAKRNAPAPVSDGTIKVSAMSGFAATEENGNTFGLGEGQSVAPGAFIETQPSSKVRLGGGLSQAVEIGSHTRVQIPTPPFNRLKLVTGTLDISRNHAEARMADDPVYDGVETQQGTIAASQARYRVTVGQGQTAIEVIDGKVHLDGTYVLKIAASGEAQAENVKDSPVQKAELKSGERAIMLHVGEKQDTAVAAASPAPEAANEVVVAETETQEAVATKEPAAVQAELRSAPSHLPAPKPVQRSVPSSEPESRFAAKSLGRTSAPAGVPPAIAAPSAPRLPGFLTQAEPLSQSADAVAEAPEFSVAAAAEVVEATQDPIAAARAQLQREREQEQESARIAEQRRIEQARLEEERRRAEEQAARMAAAQEWRDNATVERLPERPVDRASEGGVENASNLYDQPGRVPSQRYQVRPDFTGNWQCRVFPAQRARYTGGVTRTQIVIRETLRGYEAYTDGVRVPNVSVEGRRIRFSPNVASIDNRYYGTIELDIEAGGARLAGDGRIRIMDGPYMRETAASLSCNRR